MPRLLKSSLFGISFVLVLSISLLHQFVQAASPFIKYEGNPIISNALAGGVLFENGIYRMWYNQTGPQISLATSTDGIYWTPYNDNPVFSDPLSPAQASAASVIHDGDIYKMWYAGVNGPYLIKYATSSDGIDWTPQGAVNLPSQPWEGGSHADATVLKVGSEYKMWYTSNDGVWKISYATSSDGINWIPYSGNPVVTASAPWDDVDAAAPSVLYDGTTYEMYYHSAGGILYAISADGVSWDKPADKNPSIIIGNFNWEGYRVLGPKAIRLSNGTTAIYYTGLSGTCNCFDIGLATDGSLPPPIFTPVPSPTPIPISSPTPIPTSIPVETINDFVVFGKEGVWLKQGIDILSGDVGANIAASGPFLDSGVEVSIGDSAHITNPQSAVFGDSVWLKQGSQVAELHYNTGGGNGIVLGSVYSPQPLPVVPALPAVPSFSAGTTDVNLAQNVTQTLGSGSYRDLIVMPSATLIFNGGIYNFNSWDIRDNAKIYFTAPTEIRIAGKLNMNSGAKVMPAPGSNINASNIKIFVTGINGSNGNIGATPKAAEFGAQNTIQANVYVPNGTLFFKQNTIATGAFLGKWVVIGDGSQITYNTAFQ